MTFKISRVTIGVLLILLGTLLLLQSLGFVTGTLGNAVWGLLLGLGGALFTRLALRHKVQWWWWLPGLGMFGLAAANFMELLAPALAERFAGLLVLGGLGLGFVLIYLTQSINWWALIPGGVMLTLGVISVVENQPLAGFKTDGLFFLGLGLTFLVLWLIPTPFGRLTWAILPALPLLIFGLWLGFNQDPAIWNIIWPAAILLVGLWLLGRGFRRRGV